MDFTGHPQSGSLWDYLIVSLLYELENKGTTHEPCIYRVKWKEEDIIICRHVDDFSLVSLGENILIDLLNELVSKVIIVAD